MAGWWPTGSASGLLKDARTVVPVIGAGLSSAAGLPSSMALAAYLAQFSEEKMTPDASEGFFAVADQVFGSNPDQRKALNRSLAHRLELSNNPNVTPKATHRALVHTPSRLIITLNYDLLIEEAARIEGIPFISVTHEQTELVISHLRTSHRRSLLIFHLHGSVSNPDSLVHDAASYRALTNNLRAVRSLETVADLTTLCFIGTRLDEPYLQATLLRISSDHPRHVLVADEPTIHEVTAPSQRAALTPSRYGVVSAAFPAGNWTDLTDFIERLARQRTQRYRLPKQDLSRPYADFIEPSLRLSKGDATTKFKEYIEHDLAGYATISTWDIARSKRAVIIGEAGVGKSSLLVRIAQQVQMPEYAVYINLAKVSRFRGIPARLLANWLRTAGSAVQPGRRAGRIAFFIDGLDEVDLRLQDEAAQALTQVANFYPQHRFVVASRRMRCISFLHAAGFIEFELFGTRRWAQDFLMSHGRSIEWLQETLPASSDLGSLTTNPFILKELHRLGERLAAGRVPQSDLYLGKLLDRLITTFCRREAERLAYSPTFLRRLLAELAAIVLLLGIETFEISQEAILKSRHPKMSYEDLTIALTEAAQRLLVWLEGSEFAFMHPIIATYLAAEHVARIDKTASRFVNAVIPDFSSSSSLNRADTGRKVPVAISRRGIRPDLYAFASLLASKSEAWRSQLWNADKTLVCRSAPLDAKFPSAVIRADILWNSLNTINGPSAVAEPEDYSSWVGDPADTLTDLLRGQEIPSVETAMRGSINDPKAPFSVRTCAISVLARSGRLTYRELSALISSAEYGFLPVCAEASRFVGGSDLLVRVAARVQRSSQHIQDRILDEILKLPEDDSVNVAHKVLVELDPDVAGRFYWKLVGVVRFRGSDLDFVNLWKLAVGERRNSFIHYLYSNREVLLHLAERLMSAVDNGQVSSALFRSATEFLQNVDDLEAQSQGIGDDVEIKEPERESKRGIPILMPGLEVPAVLKDILAGTGAKQVIDLATWVPADLRQAWNRRANLDSKLDIPADQDLLALLEQQLTITPPLLDWKSIIHHLAPDKTMLWRSPLVVRASIGNRLEQGISSLEPGNGSAARFDFLRTYGSALRLQPTPQEWVSLVLDHQFRNASWIATSFPGRAAIASLVRDSSLSEIAIVLKAIPVDQRVSLLDDVLSILYRFDSDDEDSLLAVAQAFAETNDPKPLRTISDRLPEYRPLLGGWLAAAGDGRDLGGAIELLTNDIEAGYIARYLNLHRIGWLEQVLPIRLPWPPGAGRKLFLAAGKAYGATFDNRRAAALGNTLATAACATSPVDVALHIGTVIEILGRKNLGPFVEIFEFAMKRAHERAGADNAALGLGISADAVRGRRAVVHFRTRSVFTKG